MRDAFRPADPWLGIIETPWRRNTHCGGSAVKCHSLAIALLVVVASSRPSGAINCSGTSTGRVPLPDLGQGTYQGFEGGLYAAGINDRPPAHRAAGLQVASQIVPLDTLGHAAAGGRVVLVSIG